MCLSNSPTTNEREDRNMVTTSKVISFIVALSNIAGFIPMFIAYTNGYTLDFVLTSCAVLFSFLHHITATNRSLVPYYLASPKNESNLLWLDRIFALTLCVRGLGYVYLLESESFYHFNYKFYLLVSFALICLFISDVLIKTALTTKMRFIYGMFHSTWHIVIFFVWAVVINNATKVNEIQKIMPIIINLFEE